MHKIVLAGAVTSTFTTLRKLVEHKMNVAAVFGYEPENPSLVSGYVNMHEYCKQNAIFYYPFKKINSKEIQDKLIELEPDIFFVVGLSQLVPENMLRIAKLGNIGFHPTLLPKGRGRAPIAWLILEERQGAANFFLMGEGADDGPVFVQQPFDIIEQDDASSVEGKIKSAIEIALDKWLPELNSGVWNPVPQDETNATYYGKRTPEDGWIDWSRTAKELDKLIKASASPHPGAFSFLKDERLRILSGKVDIETKIKGVCGTVLIVKGEEYLIQTGDGLLWVSRIFDDENKPRQLKVGQKLGYYTEIEIFNIKHDLKKIKEKFGL